MIQERIKVGDLIRCGKMIVMVLSLFEDSVGIADNEGCMAFVISEFDGADPNLPPVRNVYFCQSCQIMGRL